MVTVCLVRISLLGGGEREGKGEERDHEKGKERGKRGEGKEGREKNLLYSGPLRSYNSPK